MTHRGTHPLLGNNTHLIKKPDDSLSGWKFASEDTYEQEK